MATFSLIMFLLVGFMVLIAPTISMVGTVAWAACFIYAKLVHKMKWSLFRKKRWWLVALVLVPLDAYFASSVLEQHEVQIHDYRARVAFTGSDSTLTSRDVRYGEILIPSGSVVECLGYDYGTTGHNRDLSNDLCAARFSRPVKGGGISFNALSIDPAGVGLAELSDDQEVAGEPCKRGQVARFHTPTYEDRSKPSRWKFMGCKSGADDIIKLTPTPPPPKPTVWAAFWAALLPHTRGFYCC